MQLPKPRLPPCCGLWRIHLAIWLQHSRIAASRKLLPFKVPKTKSPGIVHSWTVQDLLGVGGVWRCHPFVASWFCRCAICLCFGWRRSSKSLKHSEEQSRTFGPFGLCSKPIKILGHRISLLTTHDAFVLMFQIGTPFFIGTGANAHKSANCQCCCFRSTSLWCQQSGGLKFLACLQDGDVRKQTKGVPWHCLSTGGSLEKRCRELEEQKTAVRPASPLQRKLTEIPDVELPVTCRVQFLLIGEASFSPHFESFVMSRHSKYLKIQVWRNWGISRFCSNDSFLAAAQSSLAKRDRLLWCRPIPTWPIVTTGSGEWAWLAK